MPIERGYELGFGHSHFLKTSYSKDSTGTPKVQELAYPQVQCICLGAVERTRNRGSQQRGAVKSLPDDGVLPRVPLQLGRIPPTIGIVHGHSYDIEVILTGLVVNSGVGRTEFFKEHVGGLIHEILHRVDAYPRKILDERWTDARNILQIVFGHVLFRWLRQFGTETSKSPYCLARASSSLTQVNPGERKARHELPRIHQPCGQWGIERKLALRRLCDLKSGLNLDVV